MPTGMAGLLQDAGVSKAPAGATTATPPKGMAALLADAKNAPKGGAAIPATPTAKATPSPFTAPLLGPKQPSAQPFKQNPILDKTGDFIKQNFTLPSPSPSFYDKTPEPTFTQKLGDDLSQVWKAPPPTKEAITPQSYLDDVYGGLPGIKNEKPGFISSVVGAWQKTIDDATAAIPTTNKSETDRLADTGKVGLDAINAFFTPVSYVFEKAATVPGPVGEVADVVNRIFSSLGTVGGDSTDALLQASPLSADQKAKLSPIVKQLGALAAQIAAGKATGDTFTALKEKTSTMLDTLHENTLLKELNANPDMQEHIKNLAASSKLTDQVQGNPVAEAQKLPIKIAQPTFTKEHLAGANTGKATEMSPSLRKQIRANVQEHGETATHAEMVNQGIGVRQAEAHIREAPTPQTVEEEAQAHQGALRTAVGDEHLSPDKMSVINVGPKAKDTSGLPTIKVEPKGDPNNLGGGMRLEPIKDVEIAKSAPTEPSAASNSNPEDAVNNFVKSPEKITLYRGEGAHNAGGNHFAFNKSETDTFGKNKLEGTLPAGSKIYQSQGEQDLLDFEKNTGRFPDGEKEIFEQKWKEGYAAVVGKDPMTGKPNVIVNPQYLGRFKQTGGEPVSETAQKVTDTKNAISSSGHDFDAFIQSGDMPDTFVFKPDGTLWPQFAEHVVSDIAGKMDMHYEKGMGEKFKASVDMKNPTVENLQAQAKDFLDSQHKTPKVVDSGTKSTKALETKPGESLVGKSIEAKAIEDKITKGFEQTAGYDVKSFKVAAEKTADLISSGIDNARAVARGEKPMPEGVTSGSLIAGIEEYAKAHPEEAPDILSDLANSKLASETSGHAQELGSLRMRTPDSATSHLQALKKSLIEAAGGLKR